MKEMDDTHEREINELFNPDDIAQWGETSPEEFIGIIVHEFKREIQMQQAYAELLKQALEITPIDVIGDTQTIPASYCVQVVLKSARIMGRLLDTTIAYGKTLSEEEH
jgi:hypothetical protein